MTLELGSVAAPLFPARNNPAPKYVKYAAPSHFSPCSAKDVGNT
ncbi:hypothetical protein [Chromobacterium subtsugae]